MNFPLLTTWDSIQSEIIRKYIWNRRTLSVSVTKEEDDLYFDINNKLDDPLYLRDLNSSSIINSIKYVYWETRAGVFISVRNNKLEAFIPFANARYRNDWSNGLTFYGTSPDSLCPVRDYLIHKKKVLGYTHQMMLNPACWWANQHFLNTKPKPDVWGTHSLQEYYEMIQEALKQHTVNDVQFILNKRDHPILRKDLCKPYTFLYKGEVPKISKPSKSYAPIVTSYSNDEYLDILIPIVQDWQIAAHPETYYPVENDVEWDDKIETAFFRGAATGGLENNQRLQLAKLSQDWNDLLDAGVTSWNLLDKVDSGGFVHYLIPEETGLTLQKKIPMNEQIKYKYLLNVDGHTRPNRTSWILSSSSLMLMVDPKNSDQTWISKVLKSYVHYVPIKADLSDLKEQILWCKKNDTECRAIVARANQFAKQYFTKDTIASYMAYTMNHISTNSITKRS